MWCRDQVLNDLSEHMLTLSRDKFASNVVERCLKHGTQEQQRGIIDQFLRNEPAFVQMMKDDYGNYVCFKAFEVRSCHMSLSNGNSPLMSSFKTKSVFMSPRLAWTHGFL